MIYGYARVSSNLQSESTQHFAILDYTKRNNLSIDEWVEETISSKKPLEKRKLGQLLNRVQLGDKIIITEISRLARNLYELAAILQTAINKNVEIISIKENYCFKNDLQSKIMCSTFGLASEIERDLISTRTKMCLQKLKEQNVKLGRPLGSKSNKLKLTKNTEKIKYFLKQGISQAKISKMLDVDTTTMCRFLKRTKLKETLNLKKPNQN